MTKPNVWRLSLSAFRIGEKRAALTGRAPSSVWSPTDDQHSPDAAQPELIRRYTAAGHWRDDTIYSLVRRRGQRAGEKSALRDRFRRLSYA
jgi:hypothetical protein